MSESHEPDSSRNPPWVTSGRGVSPQLKWQFGTDGSLCGLALARESGDVFIADQTGALYRLDRRGQIAALTRLHHPAIALDWSDDGSQGAVIAGENLILRFDRDLRIIHKLTLPETCLAVAVSPFGNHLAAALANGKTLIYDEQKKRVGEFETMRPLAFLKFCATEALLFSAAEHGLLSCHNLAGAEVWQQKNWSNVGSLSISGDGETLYLASFTHGVQTMNGDGASIGSYVVEGTVNRVSASYEPQKLAASTVERSLFWLDSDGELLWATALPDDVLALACDPLGEWIVCGLLNQGVYRLDWAGI